METMEVEVTERSFDWSVDVYAKLHNAPNVVDNDLEKYRHTGRTVRVVSARLHLSGDADQGLDRAERRVYLHARLVKKDGTLGSVDRLFTVWNYELADRPEWLRTVIGDLTTKARELAAAKLAAQA